MTLKHYMELKALGDTAFAALVGVNQSTVYRVRKGLQRPSWRLLDKISSETKGAVTANDFLARAK